MRERDGRGRDRGKRSKKSWKITFTRCHWEFPEDIFVGFKCDVCISSDRRAAQSRLNMCRLVCLLFPRQSSRTNQRCSHMHERANFIWVTTCHHIPAIPMSHASWGAFPIQDFPKKDPAFWYDITFLQFNNALWLQIRFACWQPGGHSLRHCTQLKETKRQNKKNLQFVI